MTQDPGVDSLVGQEGPFTLGVVRPNTRAGGGTLIMDWETEDVAVPTSCPTGDKDTRDRL